MLNMVSGFSDRNKGKFNDDFLINMRKNDSMIVYLDETCKAIAGLLSDYIVYNGYYFNDNRNKTLELNQGKEDKTGGKQKSVTIHINDTYAKEAIFEFDCHCNGQSSKQKMSIWIPMLVDKSHLYIRGNKYSAPMQIIDSITFTKGNILILKTLTRALKFERIKTTISDIYGNKYTASAVTLVSNNKKISFLLYYFAYYGFFTTLEYFGVKDIISVYSGDINSGGAVPEDKVLFKFGSVYIAIDKEQFHNKNNVSLRSFVGSILMLSKRSIDMNFLSNSVKWTMYLGETINIQKPLENGEKLLNTFISSFDHRTRTIMNQLIDDNERNNMFAAVRWLFVNYSKLCAKDEGLQSKRVRLNEYLISPFIKKLTENVYRFRNTSVKSKNLESLLNVFKIKSNIIVNAITGKIAPTKTGLSIAKFSSESNDNELFNSILNITKSGPGSPMEKTKMVGISHRQFSLDYMGNIDLIGGTSNATPGINAHVSPFADYNIEKSIFNIDPKMIKH